MKTVLKKLIDIREGEHRRVVLMFLYFFLVVTAFYILKPVRSSLVTVQVVKIQGQWRNLTDRVTGLRISLVTQTVSLRQPP